MGLFVCLELVLKLLIPSFLRRARENRTTSTARLALSFILIINLMGKYAASIARYTQNGGPPKIDIGSRIVSSSSSGKCHVSYFSAETGGS
jgi:hypothetical protein